MKRTYLIVAGLVAVLAIGSIIFTRTNGLRMPMALNDMRFGEPSVGMAEPSSMEMKLGGSDVVSIGGGGMMPPYYGSGDALNVDQRQYETYASFSVVVDDVSNYLNQLRDKYLGMDGRILQLSTNASSKYETGYMTAKVPVASFDAASQEATKGVSKVVDQSVNSTDVTGVSVSLDEQIKSLEDSIAQRQIDLDEAKTDTEKRRIQLDINRLQSQIDSYKKQLQNQQEQVQYATISVSAASSERVYNPSSTPDLGETLREAVQSVMNNLYVVAQFFIWAAVYAVVLVPAVWLIGKLRQKKQS